jgi:hypothetical protein
MINNRILFILFLVGASGAVRADQIVLKEGKILTGTITEESADELTILLAKKMILRVSKENVRSFSRSPKEIESPKSKLPLRAVVTSTPLFNPPESSALNTLDHGPLQIKTTIQTLRAPLPSADPIFSNLSGTVSFSGRWTGVPVTEDAAVRWNSLLIESTSTKTLPFWNPDQVSEEDVKSWNKSIPELDRHLNSQMDIYSDMALAAGESLLSLKASTEAELQLKSEHVWAEFLVRAEKKKQGSIRRFRQSLSPKHPR